MTDKAKVIELFLGYINIELRKEHYDEMVIRDWQERLKEITDSIVAESKQEASDGQPGND